MKKKNEYETHFRYLLSVVSYIHHFPFLTEPAISAACNIHRSTFYRMLHYIKIFDVVIEFVDTGKKRGYKILNYGILNKNKLNNWSVVDE
jgi:hypothetical protein